MSKPLSSAPELAPVGGMSAAVSSRYEALRELSGQIHERLGDELWRHGFASDQITLLPPPLANYGLERDRFTGAPALVGRWLDSQGRRRGSLVFHADGSFFVEQDILQPHPRRPGWFVEAITAWGRELTIQTELRLLPMPE